MKASNESGFSLRSCVTPTAEWTPTFRAATASPTSQARLARVWAFKPAVPLVHIKTPAGRVSVATLGDSNDQRNSNRV